MDISLRTKTDWSREMWYSCISSAVAASFFVTCLALRRVFIPRFEEERENFRVSAVLQILLPIFLLCYLVFFDGRINKTWTETLKHLAKESVGAEKSASANYRDLEVATGEDGMVAFFNIFLIVAQTFLICRYVLFYFPQLAQGGSCGTFGGLSGFLLPKCGFSEGDFSREKEQTQKEGKKQMRWYGIFWFHPKHWYGLAQMVRSIS